MKTDFRKEYDNLNARVERYIEKKIKEFTEDNEKLKIVFLPSLATETLIYHLDCPFVVDEIYIQNNVICVNDSEEKNSLSLSELNIKDKLKIVDHLHLNYFLIVNKTTENKGYIVVSDEMDVYQKDDYISAFDLIDNYLEVSNGIEDADTLGWIHSKLRENNIDTAVQFICDAWNLKLKEDK